MFSVRAGPRLSCAAPFTRNAAQHAMLALATF
jgi:hypothetical protein